MKLAIILILVFLVACSQPQNFFPSPATPTPTNVDAVERVTRHAQNFTPESTPEEIKVPLSPVENTEHVIDPYSELGCEQLLSAEQFAASCGKDASDFVITYKIGTQNCFINIRDRQNERRTAGITLSGFEDTEHAAREFERRAKVLGRNITTTVGEQSYRFSQLDRELL